MNRTDKLRIIKRWANGEARAIILSFDGMVHLKDRVVPEDEELERLRKKGYGKIIILECNDKGTESGLS